MWQKTKAFFIKYNIIIGLVLSIIGILLTIFPSERNPKLVFYYQAFDLINIKESNKNLKIYFNDEDIKKKNLNLKVYTVELKNVGSSDVGVKDYDPEIPFGIEIEDGLITGMEVVNVSMDDNYLKDIYSKLTPDSSKIILNRKIIKADQYVKLKFIVLHKEGVTPKLVSMGRISNTEIELIEGNQEGDTDWLDVFLTLFYFFAFLYGVYLVLYGIVFFIEKTQLILRKNKIKRTLSHNYDEGNKAHRTIMTIFSILGKKQFIEIMQIILDDHKRDANLSSETNIIKTVEYYYKLTEKKVIKAPSGIEKTYLSNFIQIIEIIEQSGYLANNNGKTELNGEFVKEVNLFLKKLGVSSII